MKSPTCIVINKVSDLSEIGYNYQVRFYLKNPLLNLTVCLLLICSLAFPTSVTSGTPLPGYFFVIIAISVPVCCKCEFDFHLLYKALLFSLNKIFCHENEALEEFPVTIGILMVFLLCCWLPLGWLLCSHVHHGAVLTGEAKEHREMNGVKSWAEAKEHNEITSESYRKLSSAIVYFESQIFWCIFPSVVLFHVKADGKDEW